MFFRIICLSATLLFLSSCASNDGSSVKMYGEISGGIEHTNIK